MNDSQPQEVLPPPTSTDFYYIASATDALGMAYLCDFAFEDKKYRSITHYLLVTRCAEPADAARLLYYCGYNNPMTFTASRMRWNANWTQMRESFCKNAIEQAFREQHRLDVLMKLPVTTKFINTDTTLGNYWGSDTLGGQNTYGRLLEEFRSQLG